MGGQADTKVPPSADEALELGLGALRSGREEDAIPALEQAIGQQPPDARLWQILGLLHRSTHELEPATAAFEKAAALAPGDAKIAHGLAQCRFEAGLKSEEWFVRARALAPSDLSLLQGWIAAVAAERGLAAAAALLDPELAARPGWTDGHWLMSRLRFAAGEPERSCDTLAAAARADRSSPELWHQWVRTLMKQCRHAEALEVVGEARRSISSRTIDMLEAAALSENGQLGPASAAWTRLGALGDLESMIFEARHLLRTGQAPVIAARAERLTNPQNLEPLFPYFALAWRLTGSAKLQWLEQDGLVRAYDIADRLPSLDRLGTLLRSLHTQSEQPLEQSVRRGTQTDGPLLNRIEPEIRQLRRALAQTVREHLRQLPASDPSHPQLRFARDRPLRFSGSWSVRLEDAGHHEQHVHPEGWFSSALYVALPETLGGTGKAGWLTLGQPQDSLGLDLKPIDLVEPKPGRLVLFPSTMWHGTVPYPSGERLTVAFDVARPV